MAEKQCMQTVKKEITITGHGKSKSEAFSNVFSQLRNRIYKEVDGLIIQMEPEEVYLVDTNEKKYTEKFLWIFMPRERCYYEIKAKIVVLVKYVTI